MKERKWCFWLFGWKWKRGEILMGSTSFLPFPSKTQSLQIGEKIEVKSWLKYLDKITHIFFLLFFFFWQLQSGRNKCGLPTICCFLFFFWVSLDAGFFYFLFFFILFKYDDVHESVIHHSTIQCFFFWTFFLFNFLNLFFIFLLDMNFPF